MTNMTIYEQDRQGYEALEAQHVSIELAMTRPVFVVAAWMRQHDRG